MGSSSFRTSTSIVIALFFCLVMTGCNDHTETPKATDNGYVIPQNTQFVIALQTDLSSNINQRGDTFWAYLKNDVKFDGVVVLPEKTVVYGLVKRASKYERSGDKANLLLVFDQLVHPDGTKIPIVSSLDTDKGQNTIKVKGKEIQDAKVIMDTAILAGLIGNTATEVGDQESAAAGVLIGAAIGSSAVFLSNRKEINLPVGTEISIQIEESFFVPKSHTQTPTN